MISCLNLIFKLNVVAFRFCSADQQMILKLILTWEEKKMAVKFLADRYAKLLAPYTYVMLSTQYSELLVLEFSLGLID